MIASKPIFKRSDSSTSLKKKFKVIGYLHIDNLYREQTILIFRECYALEKIHGTSAHIKWNHKLNKISFFSGGEPHEKFLKLFDPKFLFEKFSETFPNSSAIIYGEAYGGSQQAMSHTYGKTLKFVAFDVEVNDLWLNVPNAEDVVTKFGLEFVAYEKISTDLESINRERDRDSTQAIRNGVGPGKMREGVVLRPLIEVRLNNGERIISKHKRDEFKETKTAREVSPERLKVLEDAKEIAEEWATEMRLNHVLDKMPGATILDMKKIISNMIEDVFREAKGEIVESREVASAIGANRPEPPETMEITEPPDLLVLPV